MTSEILPRNTGESCALADLISDNEKLNTTVTKLTEGITTVTAKCDDLAATLVRTYSQLLDTKQRLAAQTDDQESIQNELMHTNESLRVSRSLVDEYAIEIDRRKGVQRELDATIRGLKLHIRETGLLNERAALPAEPTGFDLRIREQATAAVLYEFFSTHDYDQPLDARCVDAMLTELIKANGMDMDRVQAAINSLVDSWRAGVGQPQPEPSDGKATASEPTTEASTEQPTEQTPEQIVSGILDAVAKQLGINPDNVRVYKLKRAK
jgi:hypothetical protein